MQARTAHHTRVSTTHGCDARVQCSALTDRFSRRTRSCEQAGQYFNKIQCFCFDEQRLLPGETVDMPVFFYIDPEFLDDRTMNRCNTMTLSYTFFRATDL